MHSRRVTCAHYPYNCFTSFRVTSPYSFVSPTLTFATNHAIATATVGLTTDSDGTRVRAVLLHVDKRHGDEPKAGRVGYDTPLARQITE